MSQLDLSLDHARDTIRELPTLPDVLFRVNEIINDPISSAADLERVISNDVAISAKLLKLVNSASYGFPRKVDNLNQAIPLLGFSTIRNLVVSIAIFRVDAVAAADLKKFWLHSFAAGTIAHVLAGPLKDGSVKGASLSGLLHDIGKLIMMDNWYRESQQIQQVALRDKKSRIEVEHDLIGTDHAEIGGEIADQWRFPENIMAAISYHHKPWDAGQYQNLAKIIAAADRLAQLTPDGFCFEEGYKRSKELCSEYLDLTEEMYGGILKEMDKQSGFMEIFINNLVDNQF